MDTPSTANQLIPLFVYGALRPGRQSPERKAGMERQLRLELGEDANARVRVTLPAEVQQGVVALMAEAIRAVLGHHGEGHDDQADAAR